MSDKISDFHRYREQLSNTGRWGPNDARGTLNFLTPSQVAAAAKLVTTGETVSCSRKLAPRPTKRPGSEFLHKMASSGESAPAEGEGFGADWFALGFHGFEHTHLDSHAHVFWNARMYNDVPASQCRTTEGALSGGVESVFSGIIGRAIFFDGPQHRRVPYLDVDDVITPEDLDLWFSRHAITPQDGDSLWLRAGRDKAEAADGGWDQDNGSPGLDIDCLQWLYDKNIAALVSDTANESRPSPVEGVSNPFHVVTISSMGMWLVDNAEFGTLSQVCEASGRYEFFSTVVPLALRRATGSPVNPIAIF